MKNKITSVILKLHCLKLDDFVNISKRLFNLLSKLGGISLLFAVITFFIIQHNNYVSTANAIRADTGSNLNLIKVILDDKNMEWSILQTFRVDTYNNNWNYIINYFSADCFQEIRNIAKAMEGMNTLITQRVSGNYYLNQDPLYKDAEKVEKSLEKIMQCSPRSYWGNILYRIY